MTEQGSGQFNAGPPSKASKGTSLTEYGMIIALIAVVCIGALQLLGQNMSTLYNNSIGKLASVIIWPF